MLRWAVTASCLFFAAGPARAVLVDFESVTAPALLTTDLSGLGLDFPHAVEVFRCASSPCGVARSGVNAARGLFQTEFRRAPIVVGFSAGQSVVTLWVKSDQAPVAGREIGAVLLALDDVGRLVDGESLRFPSDASWQQMTVGGADAPPEIRTVVLTGGRAGEATTNFLAIDDLSFEGESPPPPESDETAPEVDILRPFGGEALAIPVVDVRVRVTEDRDLRSVTGSVRMGATPVASLDLCGSARSGPCPGASSPPIVFEGTQTVDLGAAAPNGAYSIRVEACDGSANCDTDFQTFLLDVPPPSPVPPVVPFRLEIDQAVQSQLSQAPAPGEFLEVRSGVPLVPGKDAVVRFYLLAIGGSRGPYTADLRANVRYRDGTSRGWRIAPNIGISSITVPVDPQNALAREQRFAAMRADPTQTLNYVVPASALEAAQFLDLQLAEGSSSLSGVAQVRFGPSPRMGLNVVRAFGPGAGGVVPSSTVETNVRRYLERAYPVSEATILSDRTLPILSGIGEILGDCGNVHWQVWAAYGTDDAPVRSFTNDPHIIPTLGVVAPGSMDGVLGCAMIGDPGDEDDRIGGTAITEPWGDVAAQEIGHRMGLIHASNAHDESDGGDAERDWPHFHGIIGDGNFGVIARRASAPGAFDLGAWFATLIDPCPGALPSQRYPSCALHTLANDGSLPHDFMSYGSSNTNLDMLVTASRRWVSGLTYRRLWAAIALGSPAVLSATDAAASEASQLQEELGGSRTEAFLVEGVIHPEGAAELVPVLRKPMPSRLLEDPGTGDYTLELLDASGNRLVEHDFATREFTHHSGHLELIREVVPFVEGVERLVVSRGASPLLDLRASRHAPVVRVVEPNGGEALARGVHRVRWEASDGDGDRLTFLVQYSPDGGSSWQGIGVVGPDDAREASVHVTELIPGNRALVRVTASDGLLTSADSSDCNFSLGTRAFPLCELLVDVKPGSCENPLNPKARGRLPVAIVGSDVFDVRWVDPGSVRLEGVAPRHWAIADVSASAPTPGGGRRLECEAERADGVPDLVLHFDAAEVIEALEASRGVLAPGEDVTLTLRANALLSGAEVESEGADDVRIVLAEIR